MDTVRKPLELDFIATGHRLKELMAERKMTIRDISEKMDVSFQAVFKWIRGDTLPTINNLYILSRLLEVSIEGILVAKEKRMILLKDFLSDHTNKRRILIVSDLNKGQALIRKYEAETGEMVNNVTCLTLAQMADKLYLWSLAEKGLEEEYEFLDAGQAAMLFRNLLFRNIKNLRYFNVEEMLDIPTAKEIFDKANLVRENGWNGKETSAAKSRIIDLKFLISEYEKYLADNKLLDKVEKYRLMLSFLKSTANAQEELGYLFGAEIFYLSEETDKFSLLEKELLSAFLCGEDRAVSLCEKELSIKDLTALADAADFYKGYGSFNEANYLANDIAEKKLPFGNVTVLCTSAAQFSAVTAALRGNGIPMKICSNYPARENDYVALAGRILDWALNDFTEKDLEAIMSSAVISLEVDDGAGGKKNALTGQRYFDHVRKAQSRREDSIILGWGYERNYKFIDHEKPYAADEREKAVLDLHESLLEIFGDGKKLYDGKNAVRPYEIYKKMLSFVETYTRGSAEYGIGIEVLRSQGRAISMEDQSLSLEENIRFIKEILAEATISDKADDSSVCVQGIGDWCALERQNVYVIGLALKDMQGSSTESPVLFDQEMTDFLGAGYMPTIRNVSEQKEKNLCRTLWTFRGKRIVFGYSAYDTTAFCENNPSVIFRELLDASKAMDMKDLPEFVYGNPSSAMGSACNPVYRDKDTYEIGLQASSSSLETLLGCPRKYAYSKLMNIPEGAFTEINFEEWLDAAHRGTFFHAIAERYVKEKLIKPATEDYGVLVDQKFVEQIAENMKQKLLEEVPAAFDGLADRETEKMVLDSVKYLQRLYEDYGNDAEHAGSFWRGLSAEQKFSGAAYSVKDFNGTEYEFILSGIIDRIDYRVDRAAQKVYLRVADYKTGRKKSKQKDLNLGKLVQYAVYEKALMDSGKVTDEGGAERFLLEYIKDKVSSLEADPALANWEYEFECFQYVFPMEPEDKEPITIRPAELEGLNLDRLKAILTIIQEERLYPDHLDLYEGLDTLAVKYPAEADGINLIKEAMSKKEKTTGKISMTSDEAKDCKYCEYYCLCEHKKAGEL